MMYSQPSTVEAGSHDKLLHQYNSWSTLWRHSIIYLLGRGLAGVLSFLAIPIYTRLLSPYDYGRYTLVVAGINLFNVVLFQWIRIALLRFLPAYMRDPKALLPTILAAFSITALLTGGLGLILILLWPSWQEMIALGIPLLWAQAWFELNLELARSRLQPVSYSVMSVVKAVLALAFGATLVLWGLRAYGPLIGMLSAMLLVGVTRHEWVKVGFACEGRLLRELIRYGLPLTATFALSFIVSTSDRFLIAYFLGAEAAGLYAASYDLVQNSLGFLMQTIMLAGFPLILRSYHAGNLQAAQKSLRNSSLLVLGLGIPGAMGIAILAPNIARSLLGMLYAEVAISILPIIAYAILVYGVLEFYYNRAFWIVESSKGILWGMLGAAIVNVILNLILIPNFGIVGAAYSTLAAYICASAVSARVSRKVFPLPRLTPDIYKIIAASLIMAAFLWFFTRQWSGIFIFLVQVLLGVGVYFVALAILVQGSKIYTWLCKKLEVL
jgi:O-antigen/teichoic acid export membrane protein